MLTAIDLGVTQTKFWVDGKRYKFDALVAVPGEDDAPADAAQKGIEILLHGERRFVGARAAQEGEAATYQVRSYAFDLADEVRWCAALGGIAQRGIAQPLQVVTGLPKDEYSKLKQQFIKHMARKWSFTMNGVAYEIDVTDVEVLPQGAGAYYSAILGDDGKVSNRERALRKVLVIDLGGRTVNVITYSGGKYVSKKSFTIFQGMVGVYHRLRKVLRNKYSVGLTAFEANQIVRCGYMDVNGQQVPVLEEVMQALRPLLLDILAEIEAEIPDWRTYQEVLLAGAASLLQTPLAGFFEGMQITVLDEYANVGGYGAYGLLQQSRRAPVQS